MTVPVELVAASGAPVLVKRGSGADAAILRTEAARLRLAAHPGVVEVVCSAGTDEAWELHLARAGHPVGSLPPMSPRQIARVVAAAASTVADLHASGLVHGHLDGDCVLVGQGSRVVLSGLGPDDAGATPADDVAALGALVLSLLAASTGTGGISTRGARSRTSIRRALGAVAETASSAHVAHRPTARRLAASLSQLAGGIEQPAIAPGPRHAAPRRRSQLPALVAAVAGATAVSIAASRLAGRHEPTGEPPAVAPVTTLSAPRSCVRAGSGAECASRVEVDGTRIVVDDRVYEVGLPGDQVVLGDWDCDASATPAVLRPDTGEVFVFGGWAGADAIEAPVTARFPGAADLLTEPQGSPGCVRLLVRRADGSTAQVPIDSARG